MSVVVTDMSLEPCPRVIIGGTLIDGTGAAPVKDSVVLVNGEWITAVGKKGEIPIPDGAEIINASGKTVIPGLIDAHMHFMGLGTRLMRTVNLRDTKNIAEALEIIKEKVSETKPGEWIQGRGWDDSKWEDRRYITKFDLDPLTPNNPVILTRVCGHLSSVNSKALEVAGVTTETPNPHGGVIDKNENGELTGVFRDAAGVVYRAIPPVSEEIKLEGLRKACDHALSLGCTGIHEAGTGAESLSIYQKALDMGYLKIRMYLMWSGGLRDHMKGLGLRTGFGNNMIKLGSAKMMIDGSMGARTAALFEPYADDSSTTGNLTIPLEDFDKNVKAVHDSGSQIGVHAIGDRAIEATINAFEKALKANPRKDHRHRIEHCEVLTTTQIERIKQLGIIPSVQPNFVGEWSGPDGLYEARLGKKRLRENNPYRTLLDNDIKICNGSDGMPFNPIYGIWSAINHWIKSSRITLEEAIRGFTLDAAYASFEEDLKGSTETGKLADIVIVNDDWTEIPSDEIKNTTVQMTLVGGKILYNKN